MSKWVTRRVNELIYESIQYGRIVLVNSWDSPYQDLKAREKARQRLLDQLHKIGKPLATMRKAIKALSDYGTLYGLETSHMRLEINNSEANLLSDEIEKAKKRVLSLVEGMKKRASS